MKYLVMSCLLAPALIENAAAPTRVEPIRNSEDLQRIIDEGKTFKKAHKALVVALGKELPFLLDDGADDAALETVAEAIDQMAEDLKVFVHNIVALKRSPSVNKRTAKKWLHLNGTNGASALMGGNKALESDM